MVIKACERPAISLTIQVKETTLMRISCDAMLEIQLLHGRLAQLLKNDSLAAYKLPEPSPNTHTRRITPLGRMPPPFWYQYTLPRPQTDFTSPIEFSSFFETFSTFLQFRRR
jgi:hypothetical protein